MTPGNILVVDDEPSVRELLREVFPSPDYQLLEAADGSEALKLARERDVSIVITDVNMPGMDGVSLLGSIRRIHPAVKTIVITGQPVVKTAVHCLKTGALDYMSKPLDIAKLRNMVDGLLNDNDTAETLQPTKRNATLDQKRRTIAGYNVVRILGEGGMGKVFLVEKDKDGERKLYALKMLHAGSGRDARRQMLRQRFLHEARAMSRVHHENIVEIIEYGATRDTQIPYIVLEYVHGKTLKHLIADGVEFDYREKTLIVRQIAQALGAIHDHDIQHRDVKPDNILVTDDLVAKVTDFGVASLPESQLTLTANIIGSPAYLSPEGCVSAKVDCRSDIFSLGAMAYELYLGRRPFEGNNFVSVAQHVRATQPIEPKKVDPNFPMSLQLVLAKMLKKKVEERYQNCKELTAELDVFLNGNATETSRLALRAMTQRLLHNDWR